MMNYDAEHVKKVLGNLKEDSMRIILTEHFLEQISKRNINDTDIEDLLESAEPAEIREVQNHYSRFELEFLLENSDELWVLIDLFNSNSIILISAVLKKGASHASDSALEFECIYDSAFDLMDLHTTNGFRYCQTVEIEQGLNIDFDTCGWPIAVEIIRASKRFKLRQDQLSSAKVNGKIEVLPELIRTRIKATLKNRNIRQRVIEMEVANDYGIKSGTFEFDVSLS